jgi:hypothetical protein
LSQAADGVLTSAVGRLQRLLETGSPAAHQSTWNDRLPICKAASVRCESRVRLPLSIAGRKERPGDYPHAPAGWGGPYAAMPMSDGELPSMSNAVSASDKVSATTQDLVGSVGG